LQPVPLAWTDDPFSSSDVLQNFPESYSVGVVITLPHQKLLQVESPHSEKTTTAHYKKEICVKKIIGVDISSCKCIQHSFPINYVPRIGP